MNKLIFFTILLLFSLLFIFDCKKKPAEPEDINIFDPDNKETGGDPFNLEATIANNGVLLSWQEIVYDNIAGYRVYRSTNKPDDYIQHIDINDNTYLDLLVVNGYIYWYRVAAVNKAGHESTPSSPVSVEVASIISVPFVLTDTVGMITDTSALCGGTVISEQGSSIAARGICWSTNQGPTVIDSITLEGTGIGHFTSFITGLTPFTTYYVRAYATNSVGTGYGEEMSSISHTFETGMISDSDGNTYKTIKIGSQWWLAEELRVTRYRNGDAIPEITDYSQWANMTAGACASYNNNPSNVAVYGRVYNWYAVNDIQNIAPEGWHVATDMEWQILIDYLGGNSTAGGKLKEAGTNHWDNPNTGATNESGFTALPGGVRGLDGSFGGMNIYIDWWTATAYNTSQAWMRGNGYDTERVFHESSDKRYGMYVRCVKD